MKNKIIKFQNDDFVIDVTISPDEQTVWLSQTQMADLFASSRTNIVEHIQHIYKDKELDENSTCRKFRQVRKEGDRNINREVKLYNLDMIISVGYRVNSKQGVIFRRWATDILSKYMLEGYVANEKRLEALNRTLEIQSRMLASALEINNNDVYEVTSAYADALSLLDDYDHNAIKKPKGSTSVCKLTYEECRNLIDGMIYSNTSEVFGVEKEKGKLEGILAAIYQNVFNKEVYPSVEEKAANLLYFLIKDHPFVDGRKRIGAAIFLEFLNKNNLFVCY